MKRRFLKRTLTAVLSASMLAGCVAGGMTASAEENNGMVRSFLTGKLVP